jgi:hypothetical protein
VSANLFLRYKSIPMDDLSVNLDTGWAYMTQPAVFEYGENYWKKCHALDEMMNAKKITKHRVKLVEKYADHVLDFGVGSGAFLKALPETITKKGYDINPIAVNWLHEKGIYVDPYKEGISNIKAFCFWDVLEHMVNPNDILSLMPRDSYAFISMPIMSDITEVRFSTNYKPEHLCYFTLDGIRKYMYELGFSLIEMSVREAKLREFCNYCKPMNFVFCKF